MQYTEYYNLNKPEIDDIVNINDLNDNADVLDAALHDVAAQSDIIYSKIQDTLDYLADWGKLIKNGTVQYDSGLTYVNFTDLRAESFTAYSMTCNTNIDCGSLECGYFQVNRDSVSMLNQFVTVDDIHRLSPWSGSGLESLDDTLADIYSKLGSGSGINYGTSQPSGGSDKDVYFQITSGSGSSTRISAIWQNIQGTWRQYITPTFTGTNGTTAGTSGLVPAPAVSDANKYLKSDGTWAEVQGGGGSDDHTYTTTPSEVGTWIDGRTVYEVSYSWQGSTSSSEYTIVQAEPYPQSSSSAANGIVISADLFYKNTEASNGWAPIQYAIADASVAPARFSFEDTAGDSTKYNLNLHVTTPESAGKLVCIVKYVI